jgi:hypothetical protein
VGSPAQRHNRRPAFLIALTVSIALGAGAAPAMAASVDGPDGSALDYNAGAGETNNLRVTQAGLTVVFHDDIPITTSNPACLASAGDVICAISLPTFLSVNLGDLNDQTTLTGVSFITQQTGGAGNDTLRGGENNDFFVMEPGADTYVGGDGFDEIALFMDVATTITLDGVANDGAAGEGDNVSADVEDVGTFQAQPVTVVGSAAANNLRGGDGADTIEGGAGNDTLSGGLGNDTLRARDGFADRVSCDEGTDTAVVDTLDSVSGCETVDRANAGNANDVPEDRAPAIAFLSPAPNALLRATGASVTFSALDDRGIAGVRLFDDGRLVGSATAAPYAIAYRPSGGDVGPDTLVAIATDTAGQTATAIRPVRVARFTPRRLSARVTPTHDRRAPYRFRASGTLSQPTGVTRAQGCKEGIVSVRVRRGATTVSTHRTNLRRNCTYSTTVTGRAGSLHIRAQFLGNGVLAPRTSSTRTVHAG